MSVSSRISTVVVCVVPFVFTAATAFSQNVGDAVDVRLQRDESPVAIVSGRILAKPAQGDLLLEDRLGRIHQLSSKEIAGVSVGSESFSYLPTDEAASELLKTVPGGFATQTTEHFLICSDASELYTAYCGRLLEKVFDEFDKLFRDSAVNLRPVNHKLPVLVFRETAVFQEYAKRQHPDTDFSDVPGYYSIRDNQMLISAISGDRSFRTNSDVIRELKKRPRQVETIVHEAVHQLSYNTGVQVRYADNPTWLSEGLAVYFETASGRGSLIWSRPGEPNRIHLPGFRNAATGDRLRLPLANLLAVDAAFQSPEQLADAYAESWAVTSYLIRNQRNAFDQLVLHQQRRKPMKVVSANERLAEMREVTQLDPTELEAAVIHFISRLRVRH